MRAVVTPEEMARADERAVAAGVPVAVLMERAGQAVAWAVRRACGSTYGKRVVVVCGKGNNGGDGLVAARVLRGWGVRVDVFELAGTIDHAQFERAVARANCVVDAMFGTGFRGALEDDARWVADAVHHSMAYVVAVDIPSGVNGATGAIVDEAVWADETVCFAALKPGLIFEPGRSYAGRVSVVDIGIDTSTDGPALGVVDEHDLVGWLPARPATAHKWIAGLMVVGGSSGMTGAPTMVSHAAMRAGAGIVWCEVPGADAAARASGTEVITRALPATKSGALAEAGADAVLEPLARFKAIVVGPGLGTRRSTAAAVRRIVAKAPVPLVLDADGLNALGGDLRPLQSRRAPTILTPHEGEYARLLGDAPGADRVAAARALAAAAGCVALLKGPATVVAGPDGRAAVNPTGGAALATAGTGDVLSGIIGGFLARGAAPFEAAAAGAFVHGRAADVAGHAGLVAGDLIDALPATLRGLHLDTEA
ncbi:MAG TPA: NAD(P)H-hydrate dehydratase [Acidimicrobiia bacterium]|nr:NAD(P)H-hydrate dehydratase [Acidimicrobiia bacterium]